MSLEQKIDALNDSIQKLINTITTQGVGALPVQPAVTVEVIPQDNTGSHGGQDLQTAPDVVVGARTVPETPAPVEADVNLITLASLQALAMKYITEHGNDRSLISPMLKPFGSTSLSKLDPIHYPDVHILLGGS